MVDSVTAGVYQTALDAYSQRLRASADNISNINTPNYQAKRVVFEDALKAAVQDGQGHVPITETVSLEPSRQNGNNVNLDAETVSMTDTGLRIQFATQAISSKLTGVSTAVRTN